MCRWKSQHPTSALLWSEQVLNFSIFLTMSRTFCCIMYMNVCAAARHIWQCYWAYETILPCDYQQTALLFCTYCLQHRWQSQKMLSGNIHPSLSHQDGLCCPLRNTCTRPIMKSVREWDTQTDTNLYLYYNQCTVLYVHIWIVKWVFSCLGCKVTFYYH